MTSFHNIFQSDIVSDINLAVSAVSYPSGSSIPRGKKAEYTFPVTLTLIDGDYDVVALSNGHYNFHSKYFYTNTTSPNINEWQHYDVEPTDQMSLGVDIGERVIISVKVEYGMQDEECEDVKYLCFYVTDAMFATFNDYDLFDNVKCISLLSTKDCSPGISFW